MWNDLFLEWVLWIWLFRSVSFMKEMNTCWTNSRINSTQIHTYGAVTKKRIKNHNSVIIIIIIIIIIKPYLCTWRSGDMVPLIFNLDIRWDQRCTSPPNAISPRKTSLYHFVGHRICLDTLGKWWIRFPCRVKTHDSSSSPQPSHCTKYSVRDPSNNKNNYYYYYYYYIY